MIKTQIAINGFGRIGRMVFRQAIKDDQIEVIAINARYPPETLAYLIKYDRVHGAFSGDVTVKNESLGGSGTEVMTVNAGEPEEQAGRESASEHVTEVTRKKKPEGDE